MRQNRFFPRKSGCRTPRVAAVPRLAFALPPPSLDAWDCDCDCECCLAPAVRPPPPPESESESETCMRAAFGLGRLTGECGSESEPEATRCGFELLAFAGSGDAVIRLDAFFNAAAGEAALPAVPFLPVKLERAPSAPASSALSLSVAESSAAAGGPTFFAGMFCSPPCDCSPKVFVASEEVSAVATDGTVAGTLAGFESARSSSTCFVKSGGSISDMMGADNVNPSTKASDQ